MRTARGPTFLLVAGISRSVSLPISGRRITRDAGGKEIHARGTDINPGSSSDIARSRENL